MLDDQAALDAEQNFRDALTAARGRDAETGGAAVGPHRSDLAVAHLDKGLPARQCSTGEQKALLISIVLGRRAGRSLAHRRRAALVAR